MRILLISSVDMDVQDGSTVRPYYISKNLARFGCKILHISSNPPNSQVENLRYSLKKYYRDKLWVVRTCRDLKKMYKESKEFSPDVIYAHQISNAARVLPLKYILKKPLIYDAHGSSFLETNGFQGMSKCEQLLMRIQEKIVIKTADKIILPTKDLKNFLLRKFNISENKITVVENGVDMEFFEPKKLSKKVKEELNIYNKDKVVVFTCPRFLKQNEIALKYFFKLVPNIEEKIRNIKFVIVGGGPNFKPPTPNVVYTGFVDDIAAYINLADVCIAPYPPSSIYGTAGAKNKIIEYLACGKPVIATEEGIRGFVDVKPEKHFLLALDSNEFIDKVLLIVANNNISKKLALNARKFSVDYDWAKLSKKVFNTLKSTKKENSMYENV